MTMRSKKNREIPATYRWFAIGFGVFFTIAATHAAGGQPSTSAAADTNLLSAILRAAISDAGRVELRVDPRPLVADSELYDVQPGAFFPVSPAVMRRRTGAIRAAGLRTVDATKMGQNKDCPGIFVISKRHDRCPIEALDVLAVGLPRPGRDVLPGDQVYDRDVERAALGYWAARVIRTGLGQGGSSLYASDYVLAKRAGRWVVIKIVGLAYSE